MGYPYHRNRSGAARPYLANGGPIAAGILFLIGLCDLARCGIRAVWDRTVRQARDRRRRPPVE